MALHSSRLSYQVPVAMLTNTPLHQDLTVQVYSIRQH